MLGRRVSEPRDVVVDIELEKIPSTVTQEEGLQSEQLAQEEAEHADENTKMLPTAPTDEADGGLQKKVAENLTFYHDIVLSANVNSFRKKFLKDLEKGNLEGMLVTRKGAYILSSLAQSRKNEEKLTEILSLVLDSNLSDEHIETLLASEDEFGYSAMEYAAFCGKTGLLERMVERYCRLTDKLPLSSKKRTLLHSSASGGHLTTCKVILAKWPDSIDAQDIDGFTALHMASAYKHDEVIVLLLEQNASLVLCNNKGEPSLIYAMCSPSVKEHLLRRCDEAFRFSDPGPFTKKDSVIFSLMVPHTITNADIPQTPVENGIATTDGPSVSKPSQNAAVKHTENKVKEAAKIRETEILASMVKLDLETIQDFLLHPFCRASVELKMQRLRIFCMLDLVFYLVYICLFTGLSICRGAVGTTFFGNNSTTNVTVESDPGDYLGLKVAISSLSIGNLAIEMVFFSYIVGKRCKIQKLVLNDSKVPFPARNKKIKTGFRKPIITSLLRLSIHIFTFIMTFYVGDGAQYVVPFVLLLHWCWVIFRLEALQYSGKYVMMLKTALNQFFILFLTFLPIYIGFMLTFSAMFKGHKLLEFPVVLMTGFSMIAGEHNTLELFENANPVEYTSYIIFVAFIIVLGIVVMNLLVALTVADTAVLQKEGEARLMVQHINTIRTAEEISDWIRSFFHCSIIAKQLSLLPCDSNGNPLANVESSPKKNDNGHRKVSLPERKSNMEHVHEIKLSLKECEKSDLLYEKSEDKKEGTEDKKAGAGDKKAGAGDKKAGAGDKKGCWFCFKRQCEYYLYSIFGVVLYNSSLHRKYPINDKIQADVESAATRTWKASRSKSLVRFNSNDSQELSTSRQTSRESSAYPANETRGTSTSRQISRESKSLGNGQLNNSKSRNPSGLSGTSKCTEIREEEDFLVKGGEAASTSRQLSKETKSRGKKQQKNPKPQKPFGQSETSKPPETREEKEDFLEGGWEALDKSHC